MNLSQSRVKLFESPHCPRKLQGELTGEIKGYTSLPMMYGNYFETKAGLGTSGRSEPILDLPRLKNGAKSSAHQRIDEQAKKFQRMFNRKAKEWTGFEILQKQLYVNKGNIEGTIDFTITGDIPSDLKLTADLESEWGYWSNPGELDTIQSATYCYLYNKDVFHYWVYDYSPKMNVLNVEVKVTDEAIRSALERFDAVEATIDNYEEEWPRIPSVSSCRYCMLKCDKRINKAGYNQIKITI